MAFSPAASPRGSSAGGGGELVRVYFEDAAAAQNFTTLQVTPVMSVGHVVSVASAKSGAKNEMSLVVQTEEPGLFRVLEPDEVVHVVVQALLEQGVSYRFVLREKCPPPKTATTNAADPTAAAYDMSGFLQKRGYKFSKEWRPRFFTLEKDWLGYRKSPDAKELLGRISIFEAHIRPVGTGGEFQIDTQARVYELKAASSKERDAWIRALSQFSALQVEDDAMAELQTLLDDLAEAQADADEMGRWPPDIAAFDAAWSSFLKKRSGAPVVGRSATRSAQGTGGMFDGAAPEEEEEEDAPAGGGGNEGGQEDSRPSRWHSAAAAAAAGGGSSSQFDSYLTGGGELLFTDDHPPSVAARPVPFASGGSLFGAGAGDDAADDSGVHQHRKRSDAVALPPPSAGGGGGGGGGVGVGGGGRRGPGLDDLGLGIDDDEVEKLVQDAGPSQERSAEAARAAGGVTTTVRPNRWGSSLFEEDEPDHGADEQPVFGDTAKALAARRAGAASRARGGAPALFGGSSPTGEVSAAGGSGSSQPPSSRDAPGAASGVAGVQALAPRSVGENGGDASGSSGGAGGSASSVVASATARQPAVRATTSPPTPAGKSASPPPAVPSPRTSPAPPVPVSVPTSGPDRNTSHVPARAPAAAPVSAPLPSAAPGTSGSVSLPAPAVSAVAARAATPDRAAAFSSSSSSSSSSAAAAASVRTSAPLPDRPVPVAVAGSLASTTSAPSQRTSAAPAPAARRNVLDMFGGGEDDDDEEQETAAGTAAQSRNPGTLQQSNSKARAASAWQSKSDLFGGADDDEEEHNGKPAGLPVVAAAAAAAAGSRPGNKSGGGDLFAILAERDELDDDVSGLLASSAKTQAPGRPPAPKTTAPVKSDLFAPPPDDGDLFGESDGLFVSPGGGSGLNLRANREDALAFGALAKVARGGNSADTSPASNAGPTGPAAAARRRQRSMWDEDEDG